MRVNIVILKITLVNTIKLIATPCFLRSNLKITTQLSVLFMEKPNGNLTPSQGNVPTLLKEVVLESGNENCNNLFNLGNQRQ